MGQIILTTETAAAAEDFGQGDHHPVGGGAPPANIEEAEKSTYPVGAEVILIAGRMPGIEVTGPVAIGLFEAIEGPPPPGCTSTATGGLEEYELQVARCSSS